MSLKTVRFLLLPLIFFAACLAWPQEAEAQRRGGARPRVVVRGGVYRPIVVRPWYGYGSPWYGFGYYSYGYPWGYPRGPYGYYGRYDELNASLRLEVTPRTAEVFVDGYPAGTVDEYDGIFQRLRLRPGGHEVTLYHDGYRTVTQRIYFNTNADEKFRHTMVPLAPGETPEPRPEPPPPPASGPSGYEDPDPRPAPAAPDAAFGSVSIRVQPADADILIDGEPWTGPAGQERLTVDLARGRHRVEVRKDGYDTYTRDIDVRAGETATLNISLPRR